MLNMASISTTSTPTPPSVAASGPGWRRWTRPSATAVILVTGSLLVFALFVLTALDVGGLATWWENGHWTLTAVMAVGLAVVGARNVAGTERQVRALGAVAVTVYLAGQLLWDVQVALGQYPVPAPSDVLFLGMVVPFAAALTLADRAHGSRGELRTFFLDAAVVTAAIVAAVFFVFERVAAGAVGGLGVVLLLYPIFFLGLAATIVVAALLTRSALATRGLYLAAFGIAVLGANWIWYIATAIQGGPTTGSLMNMLGSIGTILIGLGIASWQIVPSPSGRLGHCRS